MKSKLLAVVLGAFLIQPAFAETIGKDVDTLKSYSVEKKNEAVAYGKKMMSAADRDIKKLERKAAKASDETKAQFAQDAKDLRATRDAAKQKLDEMGKASGVNSTLQRFGAAFAIALATAVFAANGHIGTAASFQAGFRPALAVVASLSVLGAVVALAVGARAAAVPREQALAEAA